MFDNKQEKPKSVVKQLVSRVIIPIITLVFVIISVFSTLIFSGEKEASQERMSLIAAQIAKEIELIYTEGRFVSQTMAEAQENGLFGKREASIEYAKDILSDQVDFTAVYFCYEPNSDGKDSIYVSTNDPLLLNAVDSKGRFLPYWFRDKSGSQKQNIKLETSKNMETSMYYAGAKELFNRLGKASPMLTEPYEYQGKMIVEQVYPIIIDGDFAGIAGVDRSLQKLRSLLLETKGKQQLDIFVISKGNRFVSSTSDQHDSLVSQKVSQTDYKSIFSDANLFSDNGEVKTYTDPYTDKPSYIYSANVEGAEWTVIAIQPIELITNPIWQEVLTVTGIIVLIVLLVIVFLSKIINKIRKSDEALFESQQHLQHILETSPVGIGISTNGIFRYCNARLQELLQVKAGDSVEEINLSESDQQEIAKTLKETGKVENLNLSYTSANGETKDYLASYYPVRYQGEKGYLGWAVDISDLKKFQAEIKESEEQFRTLVSNISGIVYRSMPDEAMELIYINDEIESFSAYPRTDFVGEKAKRNLLDITHPEDKERRLKVIQDGIKNHKPYFGEFRMVDKFGNVKWVFSKGQAQYDNEGKPLYLDGTIFDITEQKEAAQKIEELNRNLVAFLDNSPDFLYIKDKDLRIALASQSLASLLGFKNWEELVGKDDFDLFSKEYATEYRKAELELMSSEKEVISEDKYERPDQTEGYIRNRKKPLLDENGEVIGLIGIGTEITDIVRVRKELEAAKDEAEKATEAKSEFLAKMSHEIRTPMNAVIGLSHLALRTELTPRQKDYIKKIHDSGNALLGIINDILDFSKIEAGKFELEEVPFDLEHVFQELSNVVTYKAHEKNLELVFGIDADVPLNLIGDALRLDQILINLVNNAVKFTNEGEVFVNASLVEESEKSVVVKFTVRDTGIGISEDKIAKLFKSFSQADSSTTREYGGSGLGLSIAKGLVDLMSGEISVKSKEGVGSSFEFIIPLKKDKHQKKDQWRPMIDLRGLKVLVCDDNATSVQILKETLEGFTFDVDVCMSGEEAIKKLEKQDGKHYDIVFIDWKMPGMDGIETIEKVKNDPNISETPTFIMVTAYAKDEVFEATDRLGLRGLITKPVSQSTLFDTIMNVFGTEDQQKMLKGSKKTEPKQIHQEIKGAHILLVEDNVINQQVGKELLESMGARVSIANNGLEAIEFLETMTDTELVFMDIQMPKMDGYTATREIRKLKRNKDLPIIAITADAVSGVKEQCLEAGMDDFLTKPIDPDAVLNKLLKYLSNNSKKRSLTNDKVKEDHPKVEVDFSLIKSINTTSALKRMNDNQTLLSTILVDFYEHNKDLSAELRRLYENNELKKILQIIHTIKGTSGNIEAKALFEASKTFEAKLKEDPKIFTKELSAFEAPLAKLLDELKAFKSKVDKQEPVVEGKLDEEKLNRLYEEIRPLLNDNDIEAGKKVNELIKLPGLGNRKAKIKEVQKAVKEYDFDLALSILDQVVDMKG